MNQSFFHSNIHFRSLVLPVFIAAIMVMGALPCEAAPSNDNFANAEVIPTSSSFSVTGTDVDTTVESFEQAAGYPVANEFSRTAWYAWTAPVSGNFAVSTTYNGGFPAIIAIFKGPDTPSGSNTIVAADIFQMKVGAYVTAGQQYFISVSGTAAHNGPFVLTGALAATSTPPTVALTVKKPEAIRSTGAAGKVLVQLSAAATTDLAIAYTVGGTAVNGSDYAMLSGTVTVPAGATKAAIKVKPLSGSTGTGTVKVTVASGQGYTLGSPAKGKVKIVD